MCAGRNRRLEGRLFENALLHYNAADPVLSFNLSDQEADLCYELWSNVAMEKWKLGLTGQAGRISLVADLSVGNVLCMYIAYSTIHCFLILNKSDIVLYCWLDADGVWDNREWPASFPFNDPSSDIHSALLTPLSEWPVNLWTQIKISSYQSYVIKSGTARYSKKEVGNRG